MNYPPSLTDDVLARAFVAANGEIGIFPADAQTFLHACREDGLDILGWEVWLVDHMLDGQSLWPVPRHGHWCGLIPVCGSSTLSAVSGTGNRDQAAEEISGVALDKLIEQEWFACVRLNFTLEA